MTEAKQKGRGCIKVSASLRPHFGNPETLAQWHEALLLPLEYEVERFELNSVTDNLINVYVLTEDIPCYGGGDLQAQVHLKYMSYGINAENHTVRLNEIEFTYWDGGRWTKTIEPSTAPKKVIKHILADGSVATL